jgi:acetyl-CoA synthetase
LEILNKEIMSQYHIKNLPEYFSTHQKSVQTPDQLWGEIAEEHFVWRKKWDKVLDFDFRIPEIKWFEGAKLNITENCLDRHLLVDSDKTALIFEPNDPSEEAQYITYGDLAKRVNRMANVLKSQGISKGDRVCLYLPMIPELSIAMLACARIGAVHTVVFAGFSSKALSSRINDCDCKLIITSDGSYRGAKTIDLKGIVDDAAKDCPGLNKVLLVNRLGADIQLVEGRDEWIEPMLVKASDECEAEIMDAEDPLFILYTSGSTGKPKGMLHTTAGYMVYTAYTFKNVFQYEAGDVFWCTADIGWITGHSYIVYGPLANGATSVMFEGIPSYPNYSRFWDVIDKHKVTQFYTAPTAIRSLAKQDESFIVNHDLSSLKVIGTVGEPINDEAWDWYSEHVGRNKCPVVDTYFQTENGGIMLTPIAYVTPTKPSFATLPFIGIQPALMDANGVELYGNQVEGSLCIKFPWPSIARSIWGDHKRFKDTYFTAFDNMYFTGDGALRDEAGYYRITGRVDDVIIVSGHNFGTAPIEEAINEHSMVAESAIVGFPHDIKGNALYGYVTLNDTAAGKNQDDLAKEINHYIAEKIGSIAKLDKIQFSNALPKTRSGKIMRRILRKIACNEMDSIGDISTLLNPEVVDEIVAGKKN